MSEDISILQEIDEALRADKAHRFWQTYGKLILAACGGIVILTGISAYWKNHLQEQNIQETHLMLQANKAADDKRFTDALNALTPDSTVWTGERAANIKLQAVEVYMKLGQRDKAIAALKAIVSATSINDAVHDSALLRLHGLTGEGDIATAAAAGRPFSPLAQQIQAATLLKDGKNKDAATLLKSVIANSHPSSAEHMSALELLPLTGESIDQ